MFGYSEQLNRIERKLDRILRELLTLEVITMEALNNLSAAVEKETAVEQSAIVLIQGLAQQIKDAAGDPVAVQALADKISASSASLAAAVAANTPAAPAA